MIGIQHSINNEIDYTKNKNIILYMHAGSDNHGCEAIANTVIKMLSNSRNKNQINLLTFRKEQDEKYSLNGICTLNAEKSFDNHKLLHILYYIYRRITGDENSFIRFRYSDVLKTNSAVAISIGGDNYCYDSMLNDLRLSNAVFNEKGIKTVLLGCSIEPALIENEKIKKDLANYTTIIARESITYNALIEAFDKKSANINSLKKPNIVLVPDPAFTLKPKLCPLPDNFISNNTVGINISPQILYSAASENITIEAYMDLIDHIIINTNMNIALIPHVVWHKSDDRIPLKILYDYCTKKNYHNRISLIEDNDAETLKGYISRCRFFVGARTHSTIAAYSTCVPTLVVGYSVKAIGIATDLFKNFNVENLVLQVQKLNDKKQLTDSFIWLMQNEEILKEHLKTTIPGYSLQALEIKKIIDTL